MKRIVINLNNDNVIKSIDLKDDFNEAELLNIGMATLGILTKAVLDNRAKRPEYTEEDSKLDREAVYNQMVEFLSDLSNAIYPENQDLKGSPEDFMAHLDSKIKELKELEAKHE